jgi:NADH:ubiquinone oxidoreductase subunit 2 (subunit N)
MLKSVEELLDGMINIMTAIQFKTLLTPFHQWMDRFQTCIDGGEEYIE